ncbi:hypothetical protein HOY82DRAFT_599487 [Tuber indicum]|nr:hypothetical protein HOY82DRAFT_599487 [Tuber indicum]
MAQAGSVEWEEDGRLIKRLIVTTFVMVKGLEKKIRFWHVEGCVNNTKDRNENLRKVLGQSDIRATSELKGAIKTTLLMQGCGKHCGTADSSDSNDDMVSVDSLSTSAPTWVSSMNISSGEREMNRESKSDNTSDGTYVPSSRDVAMELGEGKTSEKTGPGDSKHAERSIPLPVVKMDKGKGKEVALRNMEFRFRGERGKETIENSEGEMELLEMGRNVSAVSDRNADKVTGDKRKDQDIWLDMINNLNDRIDKLEDWKIKVEKVGCVKWTGNKFQGKKTEQLVPALPLQKTGTVGRKATEKGESSWMGAKMVVEVIPSYQNKDEQRAVEKMTFAGKVSSGKQEDGFTKVERKRAPKVVTLVIGTREKHITLRFKREMNGKISYPKGVNTEIIRCELNRTLEVMGSEADFSLIKYNEWGDTMLTLEDTKAKDIVKYYGEMREMIKNIDCGMFEFVRDVRKVKMVVLGVPLARYGSKWETENWNEEACRDPARDIERANKGVVIRAKPRWTGKLWKLKERGVATGALALVVEETPEVGTGHRAVECKLKQKCRLCRAEHESKEHERKKGCKEGKGTACEHTQVLCILCGSEEHLTGSTLCNARMRNTTRSTGSSKTLIVADKTSRTGISDGSRNTILRKQKEKGVALYGNT